MIFKNNSFIYSNETIQSKFYNYGYGCFETIMGRRKKAVFLDEHIERLESSKKILKIQSNIDYATNIDILIKENIKDNNDFMIKIIENDLDSIILVKDCKHRKEDNGIKSGFINDFYQNELGFIKSTNYMLNILAREEIFERGFYEGVFVNRKEEITEGTVSNVFFIQNGELFTPSLALNILPGIVREKILKIASKNGIKTNIGKYKKENILKAEAVFFTNSLMKKGLIWANKFQEGILEKHEIIQKLEKDYVRLISNI